MRSTWNLNKHPKHYKTEESLGIECFIIQQKGLRGMRQSSRVPGHKRSEVFSAGEIVSLNTLQ